MTRNKLNSLDCSLAHALDLIGEWWTILILREAFLGTRRFDEFQRHLGIARNVLTTRLGKLCDSGILDRVPVKRGARRQEYRLTNMGRDLLPTLVALTQWGDRWIVGREGVPLKYTERTTGEEIARVTVQARDGKRLEARDIVLVPGPGATDETRARLQALHDRWQAGESPAS
jgi:DNA-binding HxlR family transcriptional regulator